MGGKAHKKYNVSRISSSERERLLEYFQKSLKHICSLIESPIPVPGKDTHGDLDLTLILKQNVGKEKLQSELEMVGLYDEKEGRSYLINLHDKIVQVDLTFTSVSKAPLINFIASYGDVGMILGLYAKKSGFKLGPHSGLEMQIASVVSGNVATFPITIRPEEICDFFGLSYSAWQKGFDRKEAIFEWLLPVVHIGELPTLLKWSDRLLYQQYIVWASSKYLPITPLDPKFPISFKYDEVLVAHQAFEARERFCRDYKHVFCATTVNDILSENYNKTFSGRDLGILMGKIRSKLPSDTIPTRGDIERIIEDVI